MTKLVLVGATNVGKSSLALYLAYDKKIENDRPHVPTIGADIMYVKNKKICIYDLAGEERFQKVGETFIRKSDIIAFCYSRNDLASYKYMIELYTKYIYLVYDKPVLFLETKCDTEKFVEYETVVDKHVIQTSSKLGVGKEEIMKIITEEEEEEEVENRHSCGGCITC